jgi:MFS family permease
MTSLGMLVGGYILSLPSIESMLISPAGSILCGYLSDRGGRRLGFAVGSATSLLGVGLEYGASGPGMLLAGKIVRFVPAFVHAGTKSQPLGQRSLFRILPHSQLRLCV